MNHKKIFLRKEIVGNQKEEENEKETREKILKFLKAEKNKKEIIFLVIYILITKNKIK